MAKKELELFDPHIGQKKIIDACLDPDINTIVGVIGRQWGKTTMAENMAAYWAFNDPNCVVYWVSPTDERSLKSYNSIIDAIYASGCVKSKKMGKGDIEIVFKNKSKILFRSAASEDNLRGSSATYLILDEAAFIKKSTLDEILLPMLFARGKKRLYLSTPKGKNWLYKAFLDGQDREKSYIKSFQFDSFSSPTANIIELNQYKDNLPTKVYEQEVLAQFVDGGSIFNNVDELMCLDFVFEPDPNQRYWAGIDVGILHDATVITILNEVGDLVSYYRWINVETEELVDAIVAINDKWKFTKVFIEDNNQGIVIYQLLYKRMNNIDPFNTNTKSKPMIINDLIGAFNTKSIKLIRDNYFRTELDGFVFKQNDLGNIKFFASNGINDDCVMSLAIARFCWKTMRFDIRYVAFF